MTKIIKKIDKTLDQIDLICDGVNSEGFLLKDKITNKVYLISYNSCFPLYFGPGDSVVADIWYDEENECLIISDFIG